MKIQICQKAMIVLKSNTTKPKVRVDCGDCVRYPDTRTLVKLLGEFTRETAGKMNEFIGRFLVEVAVDLKSLPEGEEYEAYRRQLDFNIGRLNLVW